MARRDVPPSPTSSARSAPAVRRRRPSRRCSGRCGSSTPPISRRGPVASSGSMAHDNVEGSVTDLGFIDLNVQVGPVAGGARGAPLETVVRERDGHGVRLSLVRHRTALVGEAEIGNLILLDVVADDPRFVPVGVLSVDRAEVVDTAAPLAGRVSAFWLEGRATPGSGLSAEPLVDAAARTGRPLMVPIA